MGTAEHIPISACTPNTKNQQRHLKEAYYERLHQNLQNVPRNDRVVLLGDINARVGSSTPEEDGYGSVDKTWFRKNLKKKRMPAGRPMHIVRAINYQPLL